MNGQVAALIYNPIKVELPELEAAVEAAADSGEWTVLWLPTTEDDPGKGQAQSALDSDAKLVIAVGGDGTVRAVAETMRGTGIPLALLPSGTGNLLARNLSLTLDDTPHSLATAFMGTNREIDAASIEIRRADGSVDRHAFLVMAGTGLDAKVMSNTDPKLKEKVGWLAYARALIAVGGDGTVRAVAEAMRGTGIPLALLPSGTGNLLARNLSLTLDDMPHSLATAFMGTNREIDAASIEIRRADGSVDRHAFLVMAGTGLDAKVMSNTDPKLKEKVGWLAYARALIGVLRDKNVLRVDYKLDSRRRRSERAQAIVIGNCGSLPANIMLLPDAVVDDGLLDVIVLKPESVRGWLAVVLKIFWENGVVKRTRIGRRMADFKSESVDTHQVKTLVVRLSRPEEVQLDGDPFGEMVACRVTVEPAALIIKVPNDESS